MKETKANNNKIVAVEDFSVFFAAKRKSQLLFGHLFCWIVTCVITINCKLHFSSFFAAC